MRNLKEISESLIETYNKQQSVNFIDLRDLENILGDNIILEEMIKDYNNKKVINFFHVQHVDKISKF